MPTGEPAPTPAEAQAEATLINEDEQRANIQLNALRATRNTILDAIAHLTKRQREVEAAITSLEQQQAADKALAKEDNVPAT